MSYNILNNTTRLQEVLGALQNKAAGSGGIDTSDATATANDILSGKTAYVDGEKITGAMASVAQATPSITVNATGLITASTTQDSGYVDGSTKSATKQLTTQAAKTVTPTKNEQTVVSSGVYTTGAVKVAAIPSEYITTTDATAVADEIFSGETAYVNGSKVTGTFTIEDELSDQEDLISQIQTLVQTKATPSGGLDTSDATATSADILSGKTAYIKGSKVTGNIAFQAAKTITPSTVNQIAISAGLYASGSVTVKGDHNLVASNIKSGTSIFGVTGTYEGSGGGSGNLVDYSENEDAIISKTLVTYSNDRIGSIGNSTFINCRSLTSVNFSVCTTIGYGAFCNCDSLTSISFPVCTSIGNSAFYYCESLTSVNFPACEIVNLNAFGMCKGLVSISFPVCTSIGTSAFYGCSSLTSISFPVCTSIGNSAFRAVSRLTTVELGANIPRNYASIKVSIYASAFNNCTKLTNLTLYYPSIVTLSNVTALDYTPMSTSTYTGTWGSIYVPASLVDAYKSATNWATYANRITAIDWAIPEPEPSPITFKINGVEYEALLGMTFEEWVNSEYNVQKNENDNVVGAWKIDDTLDYYTASMVYADHSRYSTERWYLAGCDYMIQANTNYTLSWLDTEHPDWVQ